MNKCGQCKHAKSFAGLFQQRVCMYGPPTIVLMPVTLPDGRLGGQTQTLRPNVGINDEAPSCFEAGVYGLDAILLANSQEDT